MGSPRYRCRREEGPQGCAYASPIQFQFYNKAPTATLSGGAWLAGAPLANLQQDLLSLRCRSSNLLLASTKFNIDLGATNIPVRTIGVARHNLTRDSLARITAGTTPGGSDIYDTGWIPVWPAVYLPEDLEWEDDNFWTGQLSDEELVGYPSQPKPPPGNGRRGDARLGRSLPLRSSRYHAVTQAHTLKCRFETDS